MCHWQGFNGSTPFLLKSKLVSNSLSFPRTISSLSFSAQNINNPPPKLTTFSPLLGQIIIKCPLQISSFTAIFKFLTGHNCLKLGQQVQARLVLHGLQPDAFVAAKIIAIYASSGDLHSAITVFDQTNNPSSLSYNSIIRAYSLHGYAEKTIGTYLQMHSMGFYGDHFTYSFVLKSCADLFYVWMGKCVHGLSLRTGLEVDMYVGTSLIHMYVKCGEISNALEVFDKMTVKDISFLNALIAGYMKNGEIFASENLFERMVCRNIVSVKDISLTAQNINTPPSKLTTISPLLEQIITKDPLQISSYAAIFEFLNGLKCLKLGQQVHALLVLHGLQPNAFVAAKMIGMYASSGDLHYAVTIFHQTNSPSSLLYNSIIRAYTLHGFPEKTIGTYLQMHCKGFCGDHFTYPFVLKSCADLFYVWMGKCVHGLSLRTGFEVDMYVGTSLIDMYVKCGEISNAQKLFDKMTAKDVSSWNALIAGYMKDGEIFAAENLFERMVCRNRVSWTAMISGYTQNGLAGQALAMFDEMSREDSEVKPNWITIMSVLPACAHSAALEHGRRVHDYASRIGLDSNASVQRALVAMYGKCGSLADARRCFEKIPWNKKDLVAWNTLITAYASHGRGLESVSTFEDMIRAGIQPDNVTFTALLSGCSHSGLIDLGLKFFNDMKIVFSVEPRVEHYACVVDLLGRAGRLVEAKELIDRMPMQPGASIWGALLAACRKHHNLELAEIAAKKLFILEPNNTGNYVLLSNMYAEIGMWKEVDNLRASIKSQGMKKTPGCSWIEINGKAHMFVGGDTHHIQAKEIYMLLESLPEKIKAAGYIPDTSFVLHDISEEEKEFTLNTHSEKLAIAFGLLNTDPSAVIRVTKNHRICGDCHTAIKFISKIYGREIILRDVNRFHHFINGSCSCGDYW